MRKEVGKGERERERESGGERGGERERGREGGRDIGRERGGEREREREGEKEGDGTQTFHTLHDRHILPLTSKLLLWLRTNSRYIFICCTQLTRMPPISCSGLDSAVFSCSRNSRWKERSVSLQQTNAVSSGLI